MEVVISSCWRPLRHPYFIRFPVVDLLRSLFKPEWSSSSQILSALTLSYFWTPRLEQDRLLGSPEPLWVGTMGNFLQLSKTPFHSAAVFIPMSSVPGWRLGSLCEALGVPDLHAQNPSLLRCPNPIWRLQHYQPSSCSDTQGSSNTIVCSWIHLFSHSQHKLHWIWGGG